ncbi:IS110 family transposase [Bradyrhizobium sp.]|uniref:IS110 family transposase n=1 Tax=Bradyrhizobium sp. TaxID=376 RepID=UPI0007C91530|nr:IS110 family transposase [Bradyrhizobium sp.]
MDILYERVAGLDVHKDTVVACLRIMVEGKAQRECRTFAATTEQLAELRRWLEESRCTHVAMEATGVYWMPVFRILGEGAFELIVANAAHIKNVPGRMEAEADGRKIPFRHLIGLLTTVPGVSAVAAPAILSEIGADMSRFRTAGHLVAWTGLCPGQNESAGKRKSSRLRKGAPWLKTMLVQCAWAAKRSKNSYYRTQFFRLQAKRGPQKAICAVAASILTAIYHILKDGTEHRDLGAAYFDRRPMEVQANRLVARLKKLGFTVQLQPTAEAA